MFDLILLFLYKSVTISHCPDRSDLSLIAFMSTTLILILIHSTNRVDARYSDLNEVRLENL